MSYLKLDRVTLDMERFDTLVKLFKNLIKDTEVTLPKLEAKNVTITRILG